MNYEYLNEMRKGKLILEALIKYGTMDTKTILTVVPEVKNLRNLNKVLQRLRDRRLIVKRYDHLCDHKGSFYQVNQNNLVRKALGVQLNYSPEKLSQKEIRYKELFHEQTIIKIMHHFHQKYSHAEVIRDIELNKSDTAKNIIMGLEDSHTLKPDLLVVFPATKERKRISIAIEFERTVKSKMRVTDKLNFYTKNTNVDGVLYIYSLSRIDHNLHELFIDRVLDKSLRIKHYGKNFLLTSAYNGDVENSLERLQNRDKSYYSFRHWINKLSTFDIDNRVNEIFL